MAVGDAGSPGVLGALLLRRKGCKQPFEFFVDPERHWLKAAQPARCAYRHETLREFGGTRGPASFDWVL